MSYLLKWKVLISTIRKSIVISVALNLFDGESLGRSLQAILVPGYIGGNASLDGRGFAISTKITKNRILGAPGPPMDTITNKLLLTKRGLGAYMPS